MKYANKSTAAIKSALTFLLLSAALLISVSFVESTSASGAKNQSNTLSKAFAALTGVFQSGEPEQEPNETYQNANPIQIPGRRSGSAKFGDPAVEPFVYTNTNADKVEDFYKFTVPTGQTWRVDVMLSFNNAAADLDLMLYKNTGTDENPILTQLAVSNGSSLTERFSPIPELDAGTYLIGVSAFDDPGNTASADYTLITARDSAPPPPTITRIVPNAASAGTGPFSLTITGTNFFDQQSTVRWGGEPRNTIYVNNNQLVAFLSAADIANPRVVSVSVFNPPSLGGQSNLVPFTITTAGISPETEPNETSTDATLLLAPGKINGSVAVGDGAVTVMQFPGGLSDPVEDIYAVTLTENSRLDLMLTGSNPQSNLALYLMKENAGSTSLDSLGNSRLGGPIQRITTPGMLPAGRYLVGVSALTGSTSYVIEASVPGNRLMQVVNNSAAPNSKVTVPVSFYSEGNENSLNFSLKFDPALLGNPQVSLGKDSSIGTLNVNSSQVPQGRIGVQLSLPKGQRFGSGAREIAKVTFTTKSSPSPDSTVVEFGDDPVVRGMVDANGNAIIGTYTPGNVAIVPGFEADVNPRPLGNGSVSIADWTQVGLFASGLDTPSDGAEFQRADCAPKNTLGDGRLTIADWVLAGRYAAGLEPVIAAGGESAPLATAALAFEKTVANNFSSFATITSEEQQQQVRNIRAVPVNFNRGQENTVIVELNAQGNENALGFSANFDTSQLTFVRATLGPDAQGAALNVNISQLDMGRIGIGLALSSGQSFPAGTRKIVLLTFNVPPASSVNATTVSFGDLPIAREVVDATANVLATTYTAGEITLLPLISQAPSLTSVAPNSVIVGGGNFVATLTGANFVDGAVARVTVNGVTTERFTEFVSSTQLRATILAQDVAETGTISVSVQNPQPVGGISNSLNISIVNPAPTVTTISPTSTAVGGQGFTMTVNGTNFVPGAMVQWNGANRITTFVSSTQLTAQITATDIASSGTATVNVVNPAPGGGNSNSVNFTIASPAPIPRITSIDPTSIMGGSAAFTLTVNGTNFTQSSVVRFNGNPLTTTFVSNTKLTADVTAAEIATPGTASITVFTPPPGGGTSNAALLTINVPPNPVPAITTLSPNTVTAGGSTFTLTVTGTGFVQTSIVRFNNQDRATTFVSATELRATITAGDIINGGLANITVFNPAPAGGTSNASTLTINFTPPVINLLSPSSAVAGGQAFQLNVTGTNFAPGSVVRWNGEDRTTAFVSVTELAAQITAADIANVGTATVTVFSPPPGGGTSNAVNFQINPAARPLPRISQLTPDNALAGSAGIVLTVTGTNFVSDSVVRWNGQPRTTTFVNSTQLKADITAADLANVGNALVTVFTPPAGGGESNTLTFAINQPPNPVPVITTISPSTVGAGTGAFVLTVNGTGFVNGSVVQFNGSNRATTFVGATQLTAQILAADIAGANTPTIRVVSPAPGGGTSNEVTLTVINPVPQITSLNPSVAAEGSPGFTLTVNGTGFVIGSQITVNGNSRITTFVNNTQLTTQITTAEITNPTILNIQVVSPQPGGGASNTVELPVRSRNPLPRLTAINPATVLAGGPGFTLVVNGTSFVQGSVVRVNGEDRQTDFVSDTTLAVQITAADVAIASALTINVFNPLPGGGMSNPLTLNITNPSPRITSINPDSVAAGSSSFTMIVNGVNFVTTSVVRLDGQNVPTTFVTGSQLTAQVPASAVASGGLVQVTVFNPAPGGGTSNALNLSTTNPTPAIISIDPVQVLAGGGNFVLTVNGAGFVPGSIVRAGGADRITTFVNGNQLTAAIPASDIVAGGTLAITVFNGSPGGGSSNTVSLFINNPVPVLTQLVPSSVAVGSEGFTLTIKGTGLVPGSTVQWNGQMRPTTFVSNTQLTISVATSDLTSVTTVPITVMNPTPGGGASNPLFFNVSALPNPTPILLSLSPNTTIAGSAGFVLTINGENFVPNAVVNWNGSPRPTTFISGIELRAQINAADVANQGSATVTAVNPAPGGGTSNPLTFTINPPNPVPTLTALVPTVVAAGSPAFTLTIVGNNFVPGAVVNFNGAQRPTTFFSATQLFAQINAADVANVGNANITVTNPAPGGGTSNARTLSISAMQNPAPVLTGLDPSSAVAGDSEFTATVFGNNFVPGAVVTVNGNPRQTLFVDPTELSVVITEADVAVPGTLEIAVINPAPGGGTSNTVAFPVIALNCQTTCLQSANYYVININRLPQGYVIIPGVNFNNPVQIQSNLTDVRRVLRGGNDPMQLLGKEYLAIQISLAAVNSSFLSGVVNSSIRCYGVSFAPVQLDNGITLTRITVLRDVMAQARLAILENRTDDMVRIAGILALLNGNDPNNRCNK
ncbi:MAG: pre-peptidase C-terminal domain-containing protein [Blastocatellales bacterium]